MGLLTRERKKQKEQYANYEQQAPERELFYRQAMPADMNSYAQYGNFNAPQYPVAPYNSAPAQPVQNLNVQPIQNNMPVQDNMPVQSAMPLQQHIRSSVPQQQMQPPQFVASFYQNQASQYLNNGWVAPQQNFEGNYNYQQEQYQNDMLINQNYNYLDQTRRIVDQRTGVASKKKNINADVIKIVVTIMVVALAICGMLIANQFITGTEVAASSGVANTVDTATVANAVTSNGTEVIDQTSYTIPAYEYEESTNWFDRFCDFLGGKLK